MSHRGGQITRSAAHLGAARVERPGTGERAAHGVALTSVVLCTTGAGSDLGRAVQSVLAQTYGDLELIIVDNRPATGAVRRAVGGVRDTRLRYVVEPVAGLSVARNTGIRHARGSVVAFTDDDCVADPGWIAGIRRVLDRYPRVACVTGRTVAQGDSTDWERLFEEFGTFDRGELPVVWRKSPTDPGLVGGTAPDDLPGADGRQSRIYPYTGVFGSGNNMAFRSTVFDSTGAFDEALGAGTPSGGGEDLDMFIRLVLADGIVAFEPSAVIRHRHRSDAAALRAQVRNYGSGLSAMITKQVLSDPDGCKLIVRKVVPGVRHLLSPTSKKNDRKSADYPFALTAIEWWGVLLGPWLYLRGRRAVRRRSAAGHRTAPQVTAAGRGS